MQIKKFQDEKKTSYEINLANTMTFKDETSEFA